MDAVIVGICGTGSEHLKEANIFSCAPISWTSVKQTHLDVVFRTEVFSL